MGFYHRKLLDSDCSFPLLLDVLPYPGSRNLPLPIFPNWGDSGICGGVSRAIVDMIPSAFHLALQAVDEIFPLGGIVEMECCVPAYRKSN